MNVTKKDLAKSEVELLVELSTEEFAPFIERGAVKVSEEVKIEGFRPGKVPYEILKQKIGEMTIMEEAARLAISKSLDKVIKDNVAGEPVGQPKVDITKLAPGNPLEYKVTLALLPKITLGDYKDLKIKQKKTEIKDGEVDRMIRDLSEMRVKETIVSREAKDADKVMADIGMFLDKVPLEGGQNKNTAIILGKDYIVPGFDRKLAGIKKGEVREFTLDYPADHHMKNLAGKKVEFKVSALEIFERQLPLLDDSFAAGFGTKNMNELKGNIRKTLQEQKDREQAQAVEREMLERIMAKAKFGDIPEMLIDHEAHNMLHELEHTVADQGGKFEDYLMSLKKTRDQLMLDLLPDAVKRVKISLLIREIAETEKIKVSAEEVEKQAKEMKAYYENAANNSPEAKKMADQVSEPGYRTYIANVLSSRKVIDRLREWNIV